MSTKVKKKQKKPSKKFKKLLVNQKKSAKVIRINFKDKILADPEYIEQVLLFGYEGCSTRIENDL